ncbi:MAG: chemotaxis response regulator protein-glutamate methylesterase, partial [Moorella sp. (in: Bacteria)]|nr:chemotaxis response regulator protein-glutamate methylesterase [Moorella sp. (in: firmicutes)]
VDDSAFMRQVLRGILEAEPDIEVCGVARDGMEAVEKAVGLQPDVITMDVNMPGMDGLVALKRILERVPARVIMVSSLTQEGADITVEALRLGAVDFVAKPGGSISLSIKHVADELVHKVRAAATARGSRPTRTMSVRALQPPPAPATGTAQAKLPHAAPPRYLVVIGVSTGGPRTLDEIVPRLPGDLLYATIIIQHMPPGFTLSLARRLDATANLKVLEASDGHKIVSGEAVVGKGGYQLKLASSGGHLICRLDTEPGVVHKPSVNVTLRSAMEAFDPGRIIGVLLTGMGDDGADAMVELRRRGGFTVAESEETAVIFGMPRAAIKKGGAEVVAPSYRIAEIVEERLRQYEQHSII